MEEIWKDIVRYEGKYQVSNMGRVKNTKTNRILKPFKLSGYDAVGLWANNERQFKLVHRLVGIAFLDWYEGCEFDHISTDKNDNTVFNLKVCTHRENCNNPITRKNISIAHTKKACNNASQLSLF